MKRANVIFETGRARRTMTTPRARSTRGAGHGLATAIALALTSLATPAISSDAPAETHRQPMSTHVSQGPVREVDRTEARLLTTPDAAYAEIETRDLALNHAYTLWWIVIGEPDACETSPCTPKDVLERTDAVDADVTNGGGVVAGPDGTAVFTSTLRKGLLGDSWFGNGVDDPETAEIHFVVNAHGPLLPSLAHSLLTSYRGGCRDDNLPAAFPDTAKADGIPGPNACAVVQDAIFQQ